MLTNIICGMHFIGRKWFNLCVSTLISSKYCYSKVMIRFLDSLLISKCFISHETFSLKKAVRDSRNIQKNKEKSFLRGKTY